MGWRSELQMMGLLDEDSSPLVIDRDYVKRWLG